MEKGKLKSVGSISVKAKGTAKTKELLLNKGIYYLAVESTNAKKGGNADYTVSVNKDAVFFTKGDTEDDKIETAKDLGVVASADTLVSDWVGFGDAIDYRTITLDTAAKLSFEINSSDAVKFTVSQMEKGKLKSVGSVSVKAGNTVSAKTKELLLNKGIYYLAVESTNAKKGGSADYTVSVNKDAVFFPKGDYSNDTWKAVASEKAVEDGSLISGWVGFGDNADFTKFNVSEDGAIRLSLDKETASALASKEIKLSCLDASGKTVALGNLDGSYLTSKKDVAAGDYYLGVQCANEKKYNTSYAITAGSLAAI